MSTCASCGDEYLLDVMEIWPEDRAFQLDTCCEDAYYAAVDDMNYFWEQADWRAFFRRTVGDLVNVRAIYSDMGCFRIDFGLELVEISQAEAKAFVAKWHRHSKPPVGWRWGHGLKNGNELVAVAMVGRPVARALDASTIVEVNRLCVNPSLHPQLVRYACSKLYGASCRAAKKRGYKRVITYTLETEAGTTLKASNFQPRAKTKGGSWNCASRPRTDKAPTCRKIRWERDL